MRKILKNGDTPSDTGGRPRAKPRQPLSADLERRLQEAGFRLTRPRRAIIGAVVSAGGALAPSEILERARADCPRVGLATVYRTLAVLDEIRGAERLQQPGGRSGFVACPASDHHHVVCRVCGRVAEFQGCTVHLMAAQVAAQTGFTVEAHTLQLMGTCPDCRLAKATIH